MAKHVQASGVHADRLKSFIERIEELEEEQAAIGSDKRDVYAEAKGVGYDVKTMRKVVQLRKMDAGDRAEQEAMLDVYLHALGMIDRVEARVASGESIRAAAAAEGMPKSTAIRQVTQNRHQVENGSVSAREMTEGDLGKPEKSCAPDSTPADPLTCTRDPIPLDSVGAAAESLVAHSTGPSPPPQPEHPKPVAVPLQEPEWTCPLRASGVRVLTCGGHIIETIPPTNSPLRGCTEPNCRHTAVAFTRSLPAPGDGDDLTIPPYLRRELVRA